MSQTAGEPFCTELSPVTRLTSTTRCVRGLEVGGPSFPRRPLGTGSGAGSTAEGRVHPGWTSSSSASGPSSGRTPSCTWSSTSSTWGSGGGSSFFVSPDTGSVPCTSPPSGSRGAGGTPSPSSLSSTPAAHSRRSPGWARVESPEPKRVAGNLRHSKRSVSESYTHRAGFRSVNLCSRIRSPPYRHIPRVRSLVSPKIGTGRQSGDGS